MGNIEKIDFTLTTDSGKEGLKTTIDGKEFFIDFTNEDQTSLRDFFAIVLKQLEKNLFNFEFIDPDIVKNEMLKKVSKEYIDMLNNEINVVYQEIKDVIKKEAKELKKINLSQCIISDEELNTLWTGRGIHLKEVFKNAFESNQYKFFIDGMEKGIFKNVNDFHSQLSKKFPDDTDIEMNNLIENITYRVPILVTLKENGVYSITNGRHRITVGKELKKEYLYGIID
ncbi:MAG: hypothetical protein K5762_04070 [Bacilli bacterium]|nr:hypothetical protein [Bacilli bacterium]